MSRRRGIERAFTTKAAIGPVHRGVIAVIGIDRYVRWPRLSNAVRDASSTTALFRRLGFEQITALFDAQATGTAIQSLVTDDLRKLGPDDSLVLFYAGHGGTRIHRLGDQVIKTGYLIPVDASGSPDKVATWVDLEAWLRAVSLLPARHILVILDACHSGIALDPIIKWRDLTSWQDVPLCDLRARRSRRIITSALDDQVALDGGPVHGHSLFTGCLLEALTHGVPRVGSRMTTGSGLGLYLQQRVATYPGSRQTPDFGTFAFDDRGEMVIPFVIERLEEPGPAADAASRADAGNITTPELVSAPRQPAMVTPAPSLPRTLTTGTLGTITLTSEPASAERVPGRGRRWTVIGVPVATLVIALIGYRISEPTALPEPPAPIARSCPSGMMPVPAGTFRMGSPEGFGQPDEYPSHEVTLPAYCIDRTEVTVKAYAACVAAKGCSAPQLTVNWKGYSPNDVKIFSRLCNGHDRPDHPLNCVDWNQAVAYCEWSHKRLPTEAEWEYAARGSDGRTYPWGNEPPSATRLNACGPECAAWAKHVRNREWKPMYDASDGWETTAPVGSFPAGASPFGALDMAGNVWEWTADWYEKYPNAPPIPHAVKTDPFLVYRGGAWYIQEPDGVRAAIRNGGAPSNRDSHVGFRCASVD